MLGSALLHFTDNFTTGNFINRPQNQQSILHLDGGWNSSDLPELHWPASYERKKVFETTTHNTLSYSFKVTDPLLHFIPIATIGRKRIKKCSGICGRGVIFQAKIFLKIKVIHLWEENCLWDYELKVVFFLNSVISECVYLWGIKREKNRCFLLNLKL